MNKSEYISGGKVILAAGAFSASLLPSEIGVIEMFQGVGSAILLKGPSTPSRISRDYVYRSPNRGGAQCGSHLVPTSDGNWYLGAGNYLAELDEYGHRLETIKYLMGNLSNEIFNLNETYQAKAEFVIGSRPRTLDGIPAIGPLDSCDDIFVAAGMNRIGLSISPWVAEQVCLWTDSKPISHILHTWKPDRTPISFNYFGDNVTEFCETRIANAQEHNLIGKDKKEIQAKRRELSDWALQANMQIVNSHNLPSEYCVHPDMLSLMLRRLETPLK
ncbi:FAD-binding oxidoreductase [Rhodobacteraceae bacterium]|nr:FAD-binding oxidoreductase [Paracoccaceae bacterium]